MTTSPAWKPDVLGAGYDQLELDLGPDPDREGQVRATLVRHTPGVAGPPATQAVLYVHGYSDYFFQTELADFFAARGAAFYALDLRKCGRARRPGQTPHYVSDLALYDDELELAMSVIADEHPDCEVTLVAHSTGGLVVPLWLDRRRRTGSSRPVSRLVLNSPWLDQHGSAFLRGPLTWAVRATARVLPHRVIAPSNATYSNSIHVSGTGEWDYDTTMKPIDSFTVALGWFNAVRRGHAGLHRGIEVGVPTLVLHSDKTHFARDHSDLTDRADTVLDVEQIARWSTRLGRHVTAVAVPDARHDVFLSLAAPRAEAYRVMGEWWDQRVAE